MVNNSDKSENSWNSKVLSGDFLQSILETVQEPLLVLDTQLRLIDANSNLFKVFNITNKEGLISAFESEQGIFENLKTILEKALPLKKPVENSAVSLNDPVVGTKNFKVNARKLNESDYILVSLSLNEDSDNDGLDFDELFSQAPAMICILRGPDHVFERANENYFQIVGHRDIIGKTVREALPELKGQGFYEMLDEVYDSGKAFIGNEIPVKIDVGDNELKNSFLDFVYQPILERSGRVSGIFVHAIDITEKVTARRKLEESENELRYLIDTVPAIIWITGPDGQNQYLNKNWYKFTGQTVESAKDFGWLEAVHPDDRPKVEQNFLKANSKRQDFHDSFRLKNKRGEYRWVLDSGSPKYNSDGQYEGMIGTVVDVNEEKVKEQLLLEKEHRIRSIIEEANVATALYTGNEMKIEMANEAMINLWGKDRSVIGTTLHEALPELEGQPFHDLLQEVYATGKTYWGKEDPVNLVIDNKLQTGYFNFTYKALKDEKGEIYGILNMAIDVSEIVRSKELLKDSESKFRQMADLMPEKVSNINARGK